MHPNIPRWRRGERAMIRRPAAVLSTACALALGATLLSSACSEATGPAGDRIVIVSGDSQSVDVGGQASSPLVVRLEGPNGLPLPNSRVSWAVGSGGGSLDSLMSTTDASGEAHTTYISGATAGRVDVVASVSSAAVIFTVKLAPGDTGSLVAAGGSEYAVLTGSTQGIVVGARDLFGNPIAGVSVAWSTVSGILRDSLTTTDSTGRSSNLLTVGATPGVYAVQASAPRFGAVTFTMSAQ
jgi:Bacterial Ig-like domain (group 1)